VKILLKCILKPLFSILVEQYGIELITELIKLEIDGPAAIEEALLQLGVDIEFNHLFLNWITACAIDQLGIEENKYGFENADFQVSIRSFITSLPFSKSDVKHKMYGFDVKRLDSPPDDFVLEIQTPLTRRGIGISSVILDENGWNITKTIIPGADGNFTTIEFSGNNIQTAYIITSLIKPDIKEAPREFMRAPFEKLDYSFYDGTITTDTNLSFHSFTIFLILVSSLILIVRKRKKN
jgi:hypothetical protein